LPRTKNPTELIAKGGLGGVLNQGPDALMNYIINAPSEPLRR